MDSLACQVSFVNSLPPSGCRIIQHDQFSTETTRCRQLEKNPGGQTTGGQRAMAAASHFHTHCHHCHCGLFGSVKCIKAMQDGADGRLNGRQVTEASHIPFSHPSYHCWATNWGSGSGSSRECENGMDSTSATRLLPSPPTAVPEWPEHCCCCQMACSSGGSGGCENGTCPATNAALCSAHPLRFSFICLQQVVPTANWPCWVVLQWLGSSELVEATWQWHVGCLKLP